MKMVCIGDSLTYGYRIRPEKVWLRAFEKETGIIMINQGINGDTTGGMKRRFFKDVVLHQPTHTLIFGGANDILLEIPLYKIQENIEAMVRTAKEEGIIPLIGIPMEMDGKMASREWADGTDYDKANKDVLLLRDWILDYCKNNQMTGVDFFKSYQQALEKADAADYLLDGLHPTEKGQQILKNTLRQFLNL